MTQTSGTTVLTVHLPDAEARAIREAAAAQGFSTHRYMQVLLSAAVRDSVQLPSSQARRRAEPQALVSAVAPMSLMNRLELTAMQLREPSGKAVSLGSLARMIVQHFVFAKSDIMERIKAVRADYAPPVPLHHTWDPSRGREPKAQLPIKMSVDARTALERAADSRRMGLSPLVVQILDRALPHFDWLKQDT